MDIAPGVRLGPYKILQPLGSGGMGAVYLAYDERLDRRVALKMLTRVSGEDARRQLRREARAIARLNHPNIAAIYDVVDHGHDAFIVMEYVDGEPLSTLVTSPPVAVDRVIDVGLQLVSAVAYAHREGIVHRDVKPGNVMLTRDGQVKLLDLGLARITSADPFAETRSASEAEPSQAGTLPYMAPERLSGRAADARTDVYSVGVVLFELLTGKRPYSAPDFTSLVLTIATHPTPRVATTRADVPAMLDDLVARAMAKDPATRYASAQELRDGLERVRDATKGVVPKSVDEITGRSSRRRTLIGVGVLALAAVLAVVAWLVSRGTPPPAPTSVPSTVAIPPVVNTSTEQADLDELGSLLQSVLSRNLTALPGITIVRAPVPAAAGSTAAAAPPATYAVSLTLRRALSGVAAEFSLSRHGEAHATTQSFTDDELGLLQSTVEGVATALTHSVLPGRVSPEDERRQLQHLPATSGPALVAYLHGRVLLDTSDNAKTDADAVAAFQDAISRDSTFAFAHAGLSQAYASLLKHTLDKTWLDRASDAANRALQIDPRCDQAHLALALVLRSAEKKDDAMVEARQAVTLTPDSDDAHRVLGLTLIDLGQNDAGIEELQTAVALRPRHWMNYYALGGGLLRVGRPADAADALQTAKAHLDSFESAYVNLGMAQMTLGRWDLAVGNLERATQLDPTDHYALNNLATAYYWDRKFDQALALYRKAIDQDPQNPLQQMNLGDTYEALGRPDEARAAYRQAVALADARRAAGFNPTTEGVAAKCEAKLKNFDGAVARALAALAQAEGNSNVLYKLAVVYALSGQSGPAMDRLEQAVGKGYSRVLVRDDPDLKSLRGNSRFKTLVGGAAR